MLTVRSIAPAELEAWAQLSDRPDRWTERSIRSRWESGSSRPEWTFLAEEGSRSLARVALAADPIGGGIEAPEHSMIAHWFAPGDEAAARSVLEAALAAAREDAATTVDARVNPEYMDQADRRRVILEQLGFRLFQEKEGFLWRADDASSLAAERALQPSTLEFASIEAVGQEALAAAMASGVRGTLDRNDRHYRDLCGLEAWAKEMLDYLDPDDASSWLLATTPAGEVAGYALLGGFDEPDRATIVHIGVVPEQRGHGYGAELLRAANEHARRRGFGRILSDVDVENGPMLAAMERAGHHAVATTWHVWHYRLELASS